MDLICIPLCHIFNQSLSLGIFPEDWKCARVTPLFKQGNRHDMNNYRPISVVPIIAKVFERIAYDQLYAYLTEHDIVCKHQSGFRTHHSTVTALLEATDTWAYNIDKGKINAVVFLDLKKAFDTVNHDVLLSKLNNYGIRDIPHKWFTSYLDKRTQKCSINGSLSQSCLLSFGVPQGTILGPLLFLLYINDLPNCLTNCQPRMYADDTHLTYAGVSTDNIESCLNNDLAKVHNWLTANKLTLNTTKAQPLPLGRGKGCLHLQIFQDPKLMELNWSSHIDKLTKKIASNIGAIKRVRHLVPQATLQNIFSALVQPHFDYCNVVWGNCGVTLQQKLQKLQNRAAHFLTYSSCDASAVNLIKILDWKDIACQQQNARATMVYKCLHGLAPEYLCSKFSKRDSVYSLRDSENKVNVPLPRTNYLKNSFSYSGAITWNNLPCEARLAESLSAFKNLL